MISSTKVNQGKRNPLSLQGCRLRYNAVLHITFVL
ncbi:MAG: hypothetical protein RIQ47_1017 [Bacteroidota bacterium]|jgi:hypothetical protein